MSTLSLPKQRISVLLLGGIHASAKDMFLADGYTDVELLSGELDEAELIKRIGSVHMLGIRSATNVNERVLTKAQKLLAIGCFCIGTNQVDLHAAMQRGIPVFNAPFSNTRSVAELVIGELLLLLRDIPAKNAAAHRGEWHKTAKGSYEARGKTLGIVGYGHIGTQVGLLAEALGMRVLYHDIEEKLSLGNATPVQSLPELLRQADVVTLHVPGGPATKNLIGAAELKLMRKGSCLINAARGQIVETQALCDALKRRHIAGAAIDVHPQEPTSKDLPFHSPLQGMENVLLTPHIAGSTAEAQQRIGVEVADRLLKYSNTGATVGAVNFPEVHLPPHAGRHRILHIHHNQPGVLAKMNDVFARSGLNIGSQYLQSYEGVSYVVTDIDQKGSATVRAQLQAIPGTIRTRILY
jgi:D-3-phosphoglycerate dehydrogenase